MSNTQKAIYFCAAIVILSVFSIYHKAEAEETKLQNIAGNIICRSAEAFRDVIMADSQMSAVLIAKAQLDSGHCAFYQNVSAVAVYSVPALVFKSRPGDIIKVWQIVTPPDIEAYIFTVEEGSAA